MAFRNRRWLTIGAVACAGVAAATVLHSPRGRRVLQRFGQLSSRIVETPAAASSGTRRNVEIKVAEAIYSGGLAPGWQDWGWAPRDAKGPGPARLNLSSSGGWILAKPGMSDARFGGVVFRVKAPKAYGDFLEVLLISEVTDAFAAVAVRPEHRVDLADGWSEVFVPMRALNPRALPFDRVRIRADKAIGAEWIAIDGVGLTAPSPGDDRPPSFPVRSIAMKIQCPLPAQKISPLIYGVASADAPDEMRATAYRWGGNRTTRYNWEVGTAANAGNDWFFKNVVQESYSAFIDKAVAKHGAVSITVPMIGWVAKDSSSYSFPVSVFGAQQQTPYGEGDVGNGFRGDGSKVTPGPPTRTSVAAPPDMVRRWVESIRQADVKRGTRSARAYILDNEPVLWNVTHRDVHPEPLSYDELLERAIQYGSAVRAADPDAIIAGPAEWGWDGYFYSAKDAVAGLRVRPDRRAHGDVPLIAWYLAKMREHEQRTGTRILDLVDVHFYPEGANVKPPGYTDAATAALRLRQTRGLWDTTYVDESWIKDTVMLIPRLKDLVAKNYPGLGISIGEWSFGAEAHVSGGLATAEALGRFGQGGVTSAYYWIAPQKGMPAYWAFRAYRNFDGSGARFLDWSLPASAGDQSSLFASRDDSGKHLVAIALNMSADSAAAATIDLGSCGSVASARAFSYWGQASGLTAVPTAATAGATRIAQTLQPYSITVLDIVMTP